MKTPNNRIKCPECQVNTMRNSRTIHGVKIKDSYFCDNCYQYFSTHDLVYKYLYDLGDFPYQPINFVQPIPFPLEYFYPSDSIVDTGSLNWMG